MLKYIFKYTHIYFDKKKNINTYNTKKIRINKKKKKRKKIKKN